MKTVTVKFGTKEVKFSTPTNDFYGGVLSDCGLFVLIDMNRYSNGPEEAWQIEFEEYDDDQERGRLAVHDDGATPQECMDKVRARFVAIEKLIKDIL